MIAVTGANGLLGSFIIRKLIEKNEPFVALRRSNADTSLVKDIQNKIDWREADIDDPVTLNEAIQGVTSVIHAAAIVSFNPRDETKIFKTNVQGTKNIVNICLKNGVKKFVHISSVAALGRVKNQNTVDENSKWTDSSLNSSYAESKYLAELEVFRAHEEGLNTVMINPSLIMAPADWNKSSAQLFKYVWKKNPFYFNGTTNVVDVRDVAHVACLLLNTQHTGERFILNATSISFHELFQKMARHFNVKPPSVKIDKSLLNMFAIAEEFRSFLLGTSPLITRETARLADTNYFYNNQKVKQVLNFEFNPIDATLQWCCEYYLRQVIDKK